MAVDSNANILCQQNWRKFCSFVFFLLSSHVCQSYRIFFCSYRLQSEALKDTQRGLDTDTHSQACTWSVETWVDMNLFCNYNDFHICPINFPTLGFVCVCVCAFPRLHDTACIFPLFYGHSSPRVFFFCLPLYLCVYISYLLFSQFSNRISNSISQTINHEQNPIFFISLISSTKLSSTTGLLLSHVGAVRNPMFRA